MNKSDSERIATVLKKTRYQPTSKIDEADLIVVNMCSVRQSAVDRVYGVLPKIKKAKSLLTGCILKKDRRKLAEKFDLVLNIKDLSKLPEILHSGSPLKIDNYLKIQPKSYISELIPIMTGCNNFCSYCVVPYVRGKEISRSAKEIICEIKKLVERGCKEIWLLGQNVNSYSAIPFPQLLRKINEIPGDFWIRFTSSHPKDFSDELIEAMAECEKATEYLNLPVQAGNNKILKQMNRLYTIEQYKKLVGKIRKKIPDITLSTDVIVGFPGETKKQFESTVKLFKDVEFDMAYISKYSPRIGTAADKLKDNVSHKEKNRREKTLTEILKKTALKHNKKYIGKEVEVLVDNHKSHKSHESFWFGKTRTYKTVKIESKKKLLGQFVKVKIINALPWGLRGKICQENQKN